MFPIVYSYCSFERIFSIIRDPNAPPDIPIARMIWIILAIADKDSTLIFYRIGDSLRQPKLEAITHSGYDDLGDLIGM